jgi:Choline/ethanolamine kinase
MELKTWLKNNKRLDVKSSESYVYLSRDGKIMSKIPKYSKTEDCIHYYNVGKKVNKIRNITPNFIHTLDLLIASETMICTYKYVKGKTLEEGLNNLRFDQFLDIFVQVLLALEIAQRNIQFCHYDLHAGNVILKKAKSKKVLLDNYEYSHNGELIPVIIDFGLACVKDIGCYKFPQYGMMHYLIPGVDMYKLLFHCYAISKGNLQRQIGSLFHFYGNEDPYKILITPINKLGEISRDYLKNVSFNKAGLYTPLDFVRWIISNMTCGIKMIPRTEYISSYKCFKKKISIPNTQSYIVRKYLEKIIGKSKILDSPEEIKKDKEMLEKYKEIYLSDQKNIEEFIFKIEPYLQYLYTIKELKLENVYHTFVSEFIASSQYKIYDDNILLVNRIKRRIFS